MSYFSLLQNKTEGAAVQTLLERVRGRGGERDDGGWGGGTTEEAGAANVSHINVLRLSRQKCLCAAPWRWLVFRRKLMSSPASGNGDPLSTHAGSVFFSHTHTHARARAHLHTHSSMRMCKRKKGRKEGRKKDTLTRVFRDLARPRWRAPLRNVL